MSDIKQEDLKKVASLLAAMGGEVPPEAKMPCEVTVCIPVHNAIFTLPKTLRSTFFTRQGMPLNIFIAENESTDGTQDLLRGFRDHTITRDSWLKWSRWRHLKIFEVPKFQDLPWRFPQEYHNIRACFQQMFMQVKTPYVLTLDADVDAPSGMVRVLLEALKNDEELGIVGIKYDDDVTHVKHGFSLMRTMQARAWATRLQADGCMCSQWCKMAADEGLRCVNLPGLTARHRKNEQD